MNRVSFLYVIFLLPLSFMWKSLYTQPSEKKYPAALNGHKFHNLWLFQPTASQRKKDQNRIVVIKYLRENEINFLKHFKRNETKRA